MYNISRFCLCLIVKTSLWSRCLKSICYQKITHAKNFSLDFISLRVIPNCGEISLASNLDTTPAYRIHQMLLVFHTKKDWTFVSLYKKFQVIWYDRCQSRIVISYPCHATFSYEAVTVTFSPPFIDDQFKGWFSPLDPCPSREIIPFADLLNCLQAIL